MNANPNGKKRGRPKKTEIQYIYEHVMSIIEILSSDLPESREKNIARMRLDEFMLWIGVAVAEKEREKI